MANNSSGGNGQRMRVVYPDPWYKKILPVSGHVLKSMKPYRGRLLASLASIFLLVSCWQSVKENPTHELASPHGVGNFMLKTGSNAVGIISAVVNGIASIPHWFSSSDRPRPASQQNTKSKNTDQTKIVSNVFITCTNAAIADRAKAGDAYAISYLQEAGAVVQDKAAELGMKNADFYKKYSNMMSGNHFPVAVLTIPNPDDISWRKGSTTLPNKITLHAVPATGYGASDCGSDGYYQLMDVPGKPTLR